MFTVVKRRIIFFSLLSALAGGFATPGCGTWRIWPFDAGGGRASHEAGTTDRIADPTVKSDPGRRQPAASLRVVHLAFDVLRVDLPLGGVRDARKVWNHVDQLRVEADAGAQLARNGLRIGVATPDSWAAITTILDNPVAETRKEQFLAEQGLPVTIQLGSISEGETIFSYGPDGRLAGKTFPVGDKLLTLDYEFRPQLGGCTDVRVGFEVRHDRGVMTWERHEGLIKQVPAYDRHTFEAVGSAVTLKPGEILVIGSNEQAGNEYLVGSRFLTALRAGERVETLLFITPQPFQVQNPGRPPS